MQGGPKHDLSPLRFSEWSSACWELQREKLLSESSEGQTWDIRFLGLFHSDDSKVMTTCQETLVGRAMSQWWDVCPEAGSRSRPNTNFQEEMPQLEVLTVSEEGVLQSLFSQPKIVFIFLPQKLDGKGVS